MRINSLLAGAALAAFVGPLAASAAVNVSINTAPYIFASFDTSGNSIAGDVAVASGDQVTNNDTPYWTATDSFNLSSAHDVLSITDLSADDIAAVELNGTIVAAAGIFAPNADGTGIFFPTPTSSGVVINGVTANGAQSINATGPFVAGANTIEIIVDNTNNGINGGSLQGGPSSLAFTGVVTPIPEPATWAVMLAGFGGLGVAMRSRRSKVAAAA